jgi:thiol:disulfide interchange protein DsbD
MKILTPFFLMLILSFGFSGIPPKHLSPKEAFTLSVIKNAEMLDTKIILAKGIHLYAKSLKYTIIKPKEFKLKFDAPMAHEIDGDMVYTDEVNVALPLAEITSKIESSRYTLLIEFQGCSDNGLCYNPMEKEFIFDVPSTSSTGFWNKITNLTTASNTGVVVDALKAESSFFVVLLFFILGLLLALTPCIFPMIPILSSILVAQSEDKNQSAIQGFFTSLVYVLSMAITYTVVGVLSGLLGADIQATMQNPWVLTAFALMFLALAFSLFGYYQIQLPSKWQSKIHTASDSAKGKGIAGTVIMGFLSAFIIGPCVAPPLAGAVIFISQTGDALLGGLALFMMSMGMGFPLLLIGLGAGRFMPKAGGWMDSVSQIFGVIMLGLSIFMLSKVVSVEITILLWALLFMGISLFMGVFSSDSKRKLVQLTGLVSLVYGISLLIGFLSGTTSMLHPFEKFTSSSTQSHFAEQTEEHQGYSLERLKKEIISSKLPVVVDFSKKSCSACRELEEFTFANQEVKEELRRFTFITIDVTNQTKEEIAILKKYNLFGTPNIIFFDTNNNHLENKSITGFVDAKRFTEHLKSIK